MKYLLDTNACIFLMKGNTEVLKHFLNKKEFGIAISTITVAELYYGIFNSIQIERNSANLINFFIGINILDFDSSSAMEYGRIRADLRKKGTPISQPDMLIAAHAKSKNLIVVTNNIKEFERITDLQIEDWLAA